MLLLLAGGVIAAVAVFAIVLSGAVFTEDTDSPANSVTAGTASLTVSPDDTIIDATDMKPNSVRSGDVTVTNTGSPAIVVLEVRGTDAEPALASALNLKIAKQGDPSVVPYDGPLAGAGHVALGTHATDQATSWTLTLSLPGHRRSRAREQELAVEFDWGVRTS